MLTIPAVDRSQPRCACLSILFERCGRWLVELSVRYRTPQTESGRRESSESRSFKPPVTSRMSDWYRRAGGEPSTASAADSLVLGQPSGKAPFW